MAIQEILLTGAVSGLGAEGDKVKVKAGYARNFLLPRGQAIPLNRANEKYVTALMKKREEREGAELSAAQESAKKLEDVKIAISVKTGKGGKLFGAVTAADVIARLKEEGIDLDKKHASMASPAKSLGKHTLHVKFHSDVVVDYAFEVVSENPIDSEEAN